MKKYICGLFAISMVLVLYIFSDNGSYNKNLSYFTIDNVEALAQGEIIIEAPCMIIPPMPLCHYYPDEGIILFGVMYN